MSSNNRFINPRDKRTPKERGRAKSAVAQWLKENGLYDDRDLRHAALGLVHWQGKERPPIYSVADIAKLPALMAAIVAGRSGR